MHSDHKFAITMNTIIINGCFKHYKLQLNISIPVQHVLPLSSFQFNEPYRHLLTNIRFSQYECFSRRLKYVLPCTKFNVFGLFWPEAPFYRMNWGVTLKILLSELSFIYDKKDERNLHSLKSLIMATIFCPPCSLR